MALAAVAAPLAAHRPCVAHAFQARRHIAAGGRPARHVLLRAVDMPVAADLAAELSSPSAVRKALLSHGWDLAWVDGVTAEMTKGKLRVTVPQIEAAIAYLESLGISLKSVENMASINKAILARPVEALRAVVEYAQRQGATGSTLASLLEAQPALLTYDVSADGKQLEKGQARASVDIVEQNGRKAAGVSWYREGTSFNSAPLSPYKPSAL